MQGAQKLRSEAHFQVRRNDEVAAQRSRWTFYETIIFALTPLRFMNNVREKDFCARPLRPNPKPLTFWREP
jgi:hypothetical protein